MEEQHDLERTARILLEQDEAELARDVLTRYSADKAQRALNIGNALASSLEARTKLLIGIPKPDADAKLQALSYNMIRCGTHPGEPPL